MKKNGFIPIIILIFAILGVVGYLGYKTYVSKLPAPNSTVTPNLDENWKTYTNTELGFSFKYPSIDALRTYDLGAKGSTSTLQSDREFWVAYPDSDVIILSIRIYKSSLSAQEWWNTQGIDKYNQLLKNAYAADLESQPKLGLRDLEVTKSSVNEEVIVVAKSQLISSILSVASHDGWVYVFEQKDQLPNKMSLEISYKIISTFKFTK